VNNIPPINKGIQVLEKGSNFLSGVFLRWLQSVESRLNRAVVTDANGNIAYGDYTIPDDVDSTYQWFFYNGNCKASKSGVIYEFANCYLSESPASFKSLSSGYCSYTVQTGELFIIRGSTVSATQEGEIMDMSVIISPT
jgi:hypothetical protein